MCILYAKIRHDDAGMPYKGMLWHINMQQQQQTKQKKSGNLKHLKKIEIEIAL